MQTIPRSPILKHKRKIFPLFRDWLHFQQYSKIQTQHNFYEVISKHQSQKEPFGYGGDHVTQAEENLPPTSSLINIHRDSNPHLTLLGKQQRTWNVQRLSSDNPFGDSLDGQLINTDSDELLASGLLSRTPQQ